MEISPLGLPFTYQDAKLQTPAILLSGQLELKCESIETFPNEQLPIRIERVTSLSTSRSEQVSEALPLSVDPPRHDYVPFEELTPLPTVSLKMNFRCPVCDKEFYNKTDFKRHYMIHTGERPFGCPYCKLRAVKRSAVKHHIALKHPEFYSLYQ